MSIRHFLPVGLLVLLLPACGSSGDTATTSTTGGPTDLVNGCDLNNATDKTTETMVEVAFGGDTGLVYVPACMKIKPGTTVTFTGSFENHPLQAGTVVAGTPTPAADAVIKETTTGTSAMFTFPSAGTHPYYCEMHASVGMMGNIFVVQ